MSTVDAWAVGVDLAWSSRNPTGVALAALTADSVRVVTTECVRTDDEIISIVPTDGLPVTVAIDAPTVVPNAEGMRDCERRLQTMFGRHHAGPYPSNRRLLGAVNGGTPRGEVISQRLQRERGAIEGLPPAEHRGLSVFEVFPAPAMVLLFNLGHILPYKKKRKRTWEACREALRTYRQHLHDLRGPALEISCLDAVTSQKGVG